MVSARPWPRTSRCTACPDAARAVAAWPAELLANDYDGLPLWGCANSVAPAKRCKQDPGPYARSVGPATSDRLGVAAYR
jgi:hypothetical protein